MSWVADLLKDIPLSVVLKEKISLIELKFEESEKKVALLKTENANLNVRLLEAQKENEILKTQLRVYAESENLDENSLKIIAILAEHGSPLSLQEMESVAQLSKTQLEYTVKNLVQHNYLESYPSIYSLEPITYGLTQKGRKYALDKRLVGS